MAPFYFLLPINNKMDKGSVMSKTQVSLFRSVTTEQFPEGTIINEMPAPGVLYPDFEPRILPNGKSMGSEWLI
jgi:hypothetical protein